MKPFDERELELETPKISETLLNALSTPFQRRYRTQVKHSSLKQVIQLNFAKKEVQDGG